MYELIAQEGKSRDRLPLARMCRALSVSRADYYRWAAAAGTPQLETDLHLRDQIQRVALEMPTYGYRRITHELRRRGILANHKRVLRLMREDNLLCLRKRKQSWVNTTHSDHGLKVYPNLLPQLEVSELDQLWIADITYIRLPREFVYLAVLLDAFSRRCIGWALERTLESELALAALRMALASRAVRPGLVHHSDRGVQYASVEYTDLLRQQEIRISMGRRGNPYDNAQVESFLKTLKYEEVYLWDYEDLSEARARIDHFLEEVYNEKRLHSALGYVPPAEFERRLVQPQVA